MKKIDPIQLRYGDRSVSFPLPDEYRWTVLDRETPAAGDEDSRIDSGMKQLRIHLQASLLPKHSRVLLVIPDRTRRCRLERILPPLLDLLDGEFHASCRVLIANGSHVFQEENIVREMVGEAVWGRIPIEQHDCRADGEMTDFGLTRRGTPVLLNRRLREADLVITVGGVQFHYFAGFGGGPKMIFPGLAAYESILANHFLSLDLERGDLHSGCREGELDANPVFQDLSEAAEMVDRVLSFQVMLDGAGHIGRCECGPIRDAHRRLTETVAARYSLPLLEQADLVLASAGGFPADINLIQAHKAIHHAYTAVKPGGWLIVLAECRQGIGSETLLSYLDGGGSMTVVDKLRREYRLNGQTALALRKKAEACRIVFVSELDREIIRRTGMVPAADLAEAWKIVSSGAVGTGKSAILFPRASQFVPEAPGEGTATW